MTSNDYERRVKEIEKELQQKRDFGLAKYGHHSFQSSEENLNECDALEHLRQELIDAINYATAAIVKIDLAKEKLGLGKVVWKNDGYYRDEPGEII